MFCDVCFWHLLSVLLGVFMNVDVIKQIQSIQDKGIIIYSKYRANEFDRDDVYRESYTLIIEFNHLIAEHAVHDEKLINHTVCILNELRSIAIN
ncbi:hypothetical protein ABET72_004052 [Shigella sonnei]|jgi:hypothetical protein|nr:hypothetical protein [Escherichia coli]MCE2446424.1 hypothetical protein [Escherichia coli]HCA4471921.1 hypothetical protein [Escherichia coli]HCX4393163.1 hypothetical protein [Escherichia coli]